ncbi:MAG TPA: HD domain-containing protein [Planctomycetota bacterium]|nr:HD domain-containing protein [Planctomycetota bacterium]
MDAVARFFHEIGQLKRVPRSGWSLAGIESPESVAEHSFRTAIIAYVLALLEGADAPRAALLALIHDSGEARVGDAHRLARRYVAAGDGERRAQREQALGLPAPARAALESLVDEAKDRATREARLAKDADRLECLLQAHEYAERGHDVEEWIDTSLAEIESATARSIALAVLAGRPGDWRRI